MSKQDAFERAARYEEIAEAKREMMRKKIMRGGWTSGKRRTLLAFLLPYALWGLLRAPNHIWGEPSTAKAVVEFFFDTGRPFAIATGWILFLTWVWAIDDDDDDDDD